MSDKEKEIQRNYELGIIVGYEQAYKFLSDHAVEMFRLGKDEEAKIQRNASIIIRNEGLCLRALWDEKYPKENK